MTTTIVAQMSHIYNKMIMICFFLVWFYGISIIVGYSMPNPLNTYILNI